MNGRSTFLTICFFLTLFTHSALGANYYVLYNQSCMDRLLYVATTKDTSTEFLVYRLNANVNEKFYLEVGKESQQIQEFLPTQIYNCGNTLFDEKLVQSVNMGTDRIYLVIRKENNRYSVSQVMQISYHLQVGQQVRYQSPRYAFNIDLQRGIIGENIATSSRTEMYFEGKLENECRGAYLFTHRMPSEPKPHSDLVFVPEVGMTELRNGLNPVDAWNNSLRLEKVNNATLPEYLRMLCNNANVSSVPTNDNLVAKTPITTPNPQLTERSVPQEFDRPVNNSGVSQNLQNRAPGTNNPTSAANNPCGIASGNGYHVVQKGETLYRISKLYNVTVSQIQSWNKLGNSTNIHSCDRLAVSPPNAVGQVNQSQSQVQQGLVQQQPPLVIDNRPAVTTPAPYDNYIGVRGITQAEQQRLNNTNAAWKTTDKDYHVVAPGETIASIALKYGYTEARFRDINKMTATEVGRIGQPLRVSDCPSPTTQFSNPTPNEYGNTNFSSEFTAKSPADFSDDKRINPQFYLPSEYNQIQGNMGTNLSPELSKRTATPNTYNYDSTVPQSYDSQRSGVQVQRQVHLVKEGESLFRIAQLYGISVERVRQLNNLTPTDIIIPYQRLYVN